MRALLVLLVAVLALAGGVALAAGPPAATTDPATDVTSTTATLNGTVFPNQNPTSYYFEYGTTAAYGTRTATEGPTGGNSGKKATTPITGLAPSTTYHFRVVATNSAGTAFGSDVTFTTAAAGSTPPPGGGPPPAAPQNTVTITVTPALVTFGRPVAIAGQISGPDSGNVEVTLEESPFPFTAGFRQTSVVGRTTATGAYSLAVTPSVNTRYRVTAKTKPPVASPEAAVSVRPRVTLRLSDRTPRAGQRVRFSGTVTPAHDGKAVRIQRRTRIGWRTVTSATLLAGTPVNGVATSRFSKRLRVNRSGTYRARLTPGDGDHVAGTSARRRARVTR
jgi:hypothetical protein